MSSRLTYIAEIYEEIQEMSVAQSSSSECERHMGSAMAYGDRFVICHLSGEIRTFKMNLHHSENPVLANMSFPTACDASGFRMWSLGWGRNWSTDWASGPAQDKQATNAYKSKARCTVNLAYPPRWTLE